jgi:probable HAF family extracellular repeat protein
VAASKTTGSHAARSLTLVLLQSHRALAAEATGLGSGICDFTAILLGFSIILSSGCHEPTASTSGAIAVTVSTAGANIDLDPDGYALSVDGGPGKAVGVNATVTVADLPTGNHQVRLDGVASNCSVADTNPRSVDVIDYDKAPSLVSVLFSVSCIAMIGSIRVSTTTSGPEPDQDGYSVSVGGVARGNLATNGVLEIASVRAGQTQVELTGVSGNCAVDGTNPQTVNVAFGATAEVAFTIRCQQQASLGPRAFIWTRETGMIALPLLPGATSSAASAVNDLGQVVGTVIIGQSEHAFVWTLAGGMVDIGGLSGAVSSYATAINNAGQIAGYSVDAFGHARAFRWSPSEGMIALGVLPETVNSFARSINGSGQVVGEMCSPPRIYISCVGTTGLGLHPFRWTPDKGIEDLGSFGFDPYVGATAVNNSGDIVGFSGDGPCDAEGCGILRAVLWSANGGKSVLDDCATGGSSGFGGCYAVANAINGAGQIAGVSAAYGDPHAYLWTVAGFAQDLGSLPGSNYSAATGINDAGQVVGISSWPGPVSGNGRILEEAEVVQRLGGTSGGCYAYVVRVSMAGKKYACADGSMHGHAFFWSPAGGMVDLGVLDGRTSSSATGINNSGQVVGIAW